MAATNGNNGGNQPNINLNAEPPTPSPWRERTHPEAVRVVSLYTSIEGQADQFRTDEVCQVKSANALGQRGKPSIPSVKRATSPGFRVVPQRDFSFDYQLAAGSADGDRILRWKWAPIGSACSNLSQVRP